MFLINDAMAQTMDAAGPQSNFMMQFMPLLLIFVVFYFLLIRPQQKKIKTHLEMIASLKRGDRIVTGGGIIGVVNRIVDEKEVIVEIAENVKVRIARTTIADVLAKAGTDSGSGDEDKPNLKAVSN
jgi:preprotein translocase subunit YajC